MWVAEVVVDHLPGERLETVGGLEVDRPGIRREPDGRREGRFGRRDELRPDPLATDQLPIHVAPLVHQPMNGPVVHRRRMTFAAAILNRSMQEVEVSRQIDAPTAAVEAVLSPAAIVEFAGTYEVVEVVEHDDAVVVTATADSLETVLAFTGSPPPYIYTQRDGPFAEMYTSLSVTGAPAVVTVRSCFTFGPPLARVTDWLAIRDRRTELERLLAHIDVAVTAPSEAGTGRD